MEYDYNRIFFENRQLTNQSALRWTQMMSGVTGLVWILGLLQVFFVSTWTFYYLLPASCLLLLLPTALNYLLHWSDLHSFGLTQAKKQDIDRLTGLILGCSLIAVFLLSVTLSHYVMLAWFFPLLVACQYYSRKITMYTFFAGLCGMLSSFFLSLLLGAWDANMMSAPVLQGIRYISLETAGHAIMYVLPKVLLYCAALPLFTAITKRTELMMKKQKLSIMANQARQTIDNICDFPDTYITDCRIKMRYLAKNGVDIDAALKQMGGNVDQYNDYMLTFVGESHRKEDELFTLMDIDTLPLYGAKVHALRTKANTLGLRNLTDTAFFHEMEAYAGNMEIVQANWGKLSFEWDEACDIFTNYIQSLGLKDNATDQKGNQMTFKRWGEQLQEAFDALETYEPGRAKRILNDLLQYQIDADITQSLQNIVANIDEILKA